jgi:glycosyltransferase involved in cell wall biosynthesis
MNFSASRLRVCIVAPYAGSMLLENWEEQYAGGAEIQQVLLARELAHRGHEVSFVIQDGTRPAILEVDGITVYRYSPARIASGVNGFLKCRRLWRVLCAIRPRIIYQRMADWQTGVCAAAALRVGAVFVHAVASDRDVIPGERTDCNAWQRWMYGWGLRRATAVFAQHRRQMEAIQNRYNRNVRVFPSLYLPVCSTGESERSGVYWIAMLRPQKRPGLLLEMARRVPQWPFFIIGGLENDSSTAREFYDNVAAEACQLPNVHILGFQSPEQIDDILGSAALLVNTSPPGDEGFPVTYLQAWRQAVPTIGFASAGRDEVLRRCGWSVTDADEFARLLRYLRAEPDLLRERGMGAREYYCSHHAPSVVIPQFERFVQQALRRNSKGRSD